MAFIRVIPVSIGASFVRIGNFFNSEIVGKYSNSNFGVVFLNRGESLPRHPAQLYESLGYLILFLLRQVYKTDKKQRRIFNWTFLCWYVLYSVHY